MSRRKKTSPVLEKADLRAAGLRAISPTLDLGNNLTFPSYLATIDETRAKLTAYNEALSNLDALYSDFQKAEKDLSDLSEQMLMGVGTKYGKRSNEYQMAGGVRKDNRKRPAPKQLVLQTHQQGREAV
jgi:hypothetical protein